MTQRAVTRITSNCDQRHQCKWLKLEKLSVLAQIDFGNPSSAWAPMIQWPDLPM